MVQRVSPVLLTPNKAKHEAGLTHCQDTEAGRSQTLGLPACRWKIWYHTSGCPRIAHLGYRQRGYHDELPSSSGAEPGTGILDSNRRRGSGGEGGTAK